MDKRIYLLMAFLLAAGSVMVGQSVHALEYGAGLTDEASKVQAEVSR